MSKQWTSEKLYFSGDAYFDALLTAIDAAQDTIDLETYIFKPDSIGKQVEEHLTRAATRGVQVRLLVDGIGALSWIGNWLRTTRQSGVNIRIWNPFYVGPFVFSLIRAVQQRGGLTRMLVHLNRRTHRKYCIIDTNRAFIGSQNIAAEHLERLHGAAAWRDTAIAVEGTEIIELRQAFDHAWDRAYSPEGRRRWLGRHRLPKARHQSLVRLNFTRSHRRLLRRDFLRGLRTARARIWITTPYLSPTLVFLKALIRGRANGADVRILVPATSDVFFMRWVAISYYGVLLRGGVRIFEYQPRFLHAKSLIIDDWAMVGTSNMNIRSFRHDLEVDIVVTKEESRARLARQFQDDLNQAREITLSDWSSTSFASRLGRFFSFLLKNWL